MTRIRLPHRPAVLRVRRRWMLTFGVGALALLAVVAPACSSGKDTASTRTTPTTSGGGSSSASNAVTIDPCSIVTDAVAAKVYGAGSTVTSNVSGNNKVCSVSVMGLGYDLNITVGSVSDYGLQKSIAFENPTNFPGLGKEAVIGKSSDNTGAEPGLLYRTDRGMVYIGGESHEDKLTALGRAIADQG